ncbi:hypothetical protein MBANPS3_011682 [Mucor bainieri]
MEDPVFITSTPLVPNFTEGDAPKNQGKSDDVPNATNQVVITDDYHSQRDAR